MKFTVKLLLNSIKIFGKMFGTLRNEIATIIYNTVSSQDAKGNFIEKTPTELEIKCSIQPRLENKKVSLGSVNFIYSYSIYTDLLDLSENDYKIIFYGRTFDVVRIENFKLLSYTKIYVK